MERLTKYGNTSHENGVCCTHFNSKECHEVAGNCAMGCKWEEEAWSKLAHYEDLEEQGLLLKLPYPLGTEKLYWVDDCEIYELKAKEITFFKADKFAIRPHETVICVDNYDFYYDDFGKTVFLTKEEAEKELQRIKGNG